VKVVIAALVIILVLLQFRLWTGDGGIREVYRLKQELQRETDVTLALKERNRTLDAEVQDLKKQLSALEERARSDLGMIREGETFYQHSS
jgi:cell division protein FtsB